MKIGLISDTHIPEAMPELPGAVREVFSGVDLILHAGDLHSLDVLDHLERTAPVLAVRGNGDDGSGGRGAVPEDPRLKDTQVVACPGGITLGLVHDVLDPEEYPEWPIERSVERYFGADTDFVICGHTHVEAIKRYGRVWVVNPGSPTLPHNYAARLGTVGLMTVDEDGSGEITIVDLKTQGALPGFSVVFSQSGPVRARPSLSATSRA
jgi:hypothetical protein